MGHGRIGPPGNHASRWLTALFERRFCCAGSQNVALAAEGITVDSALVRNGLSSVPLNAVRNDSLRCPSRPVEEPTSVYEAPFVDVLAVAKAGSGDGFEQIYRALNRRVSSYVRVRGADDPDGLVNDVFLQVFKSLAGFQGCEAQFNAWVFTIARNKLIDQTRRRSRRPDESWLSQTQEGQLVALDRVEDQVVDECSSNELLAKLDCLTNEQREVVLLRIVSDLTIDTIANMLGKRPGAIKALQRRAFRTLAQHLTETEKRPEGLGVANAGHRQVSFAV